MQPPERATLTARDQCTEDQTEGQRVRLPDDPKLRVELAPGFRQQLSSEKKSSVAAAVHSPRARASKQQLDCQLGIALCARAHRTDAIDGPSSGARCAGHSTRLSLGSASITHGRPWRGQSNSCLHAPIARRCCS